MAIGPVSALDGSTEASSTDKAPPKSDALLAQIKNVARWAVVDTLETWSLDPDTPDAVHQAAGALVLVEEASALLARTPASFAALCAEAARPSVHACGADGARLAADWLKLRAVAPVSLPPSVPSALRAGVLPVLP